MLHRPAAAVLDRYLSSRSPPDHLLYQILKIVPVWGGSSGLIVEGSAWTRAGRRLRRMSFLVFLVSGISGTRVLVLLRIVRVVSVVGRSEGGCGEDGDGESRVRAMGREGEVLTSAISWDVLRVGRDAGY